MEASRHDPLFTLADDGPGLAHSARRLRGGLGFTNQCGDETTVRSETRKFGDRRQVGQVDRRMQVRLGKIAAWMHLPSRSQDQAERARQLFEIVVHECRACGVVSGRMSHAVPRKASTRRH